MSAYSFCLLGGGFISRNEALETRNVLSFFCLFRVHRQPKHLLAFLLAELGTRYDTLTDFFFSVLRGSLCIVCVSSGSVDGNHQLVIKGRFQQKQIETVLRRYISRGTFQHFEITFCGSCPPFFLQRSTLLATRVVRQRRCCRRRRGCFSCSVKRVARGARYRASRVASRPS